MTAPKKQSAFRRSRCPFGWSALGIGFFGVGGQSRAMYSLPGGRVACSACSATVLMILLVTTLAADRRAESAQILLSQFSGQENLIDAHRFSRAVSSSGMNDLGEPWTTASGTVSIYGGKEGYLFTDRNSEYPFSYPPTAGDPLGFSQASGSSYLRTFVVWPLHISFASLADRPRRVGFLMEHAGGPPQYENLAVDVNREDGSSSVYEYPASRRLVAFEETVPIESIVIHWSSGYTWGDGPRVSLDDIRFEAVPEPSGFVIGGTAAVMLSVVYMARHKQRHRLSG
jgi:hypothetical protein